MKGEDVELKRGVDDSDSEDKIEFVSCCNARNFEDRRTCRWM
jgi:hypothetical protein